jgi:hypothetical protein
MNLSEYYGFPRPLPRIRISPLHSLTTFNNNDKIAAAEKFHSSGVYYSSQNVRTKGCTIWF